MKNKLRFSSTNEILLYLSKIASENNLISALTAPAAPAPVKSPTITPRKTPSKEPDQPEQPRILPMPKPKNTTKIPIYKNKK